MTGSLWSRVRPFSLFLAVAALLQACATPEGVAPGRPEAEPRRPRAVAPVDTSRQTEAQAMAAVNEQNSLFFANADIEIDVVGRAKLQQVAERLKADNKLVARLTGYTDDLGSPSYNLALSMQRAEAAYKVLRSLGVPSMQLRYTGVGAEKVSNACRSADCRRKMRRVEISFQAAGGPNLQ